jgi:hypothetical protein
MMKKLLHFLIPVLLLFSTATLSNATSIIDFDVAGDPESSVELSNIVKYGLVWDPVVGLVPGLDGVAFSLAPGESTTFDFFDITVYGVLGGGTTDVSATLAFDAPPSSGTGTGSGSWFTFLGIFSGGQLTWDTQPSPINLSDGGSFEIHFSEICELGIGNAATVTATVTNTSAPIPEPATVLLLGSGLVGIAGFRKRFRM